MKRLLSIQLLMLALGLFSCYAYAFDVSAYKDPRSEARVASHFGPSLGECSGDAWVQATANGNREAMRLYAEMGMTNLMVYYKNEDFGLLEDIPFQVMNDLAPGNAFKYLQAQHRGVLLGVEDSLYNFGALNWGDSTSVIGAENVLIQNDRKDVLTITPSAGAGAFWTPVLADPWHLGAWAWETFGSWNGWTTRGSWEGPEPRGNIMPFHFDLISKVIVDSMHLNDSHVATLWWYVAAQDWEENTIHVNDTTYQRRYWRYPGMKINLGNFEPDNPFFDHIEVFTRADSVLQQYQNNPNTYADSLIRGCDSTLTPIPGDNRFEKEHGSHPTAWGGLNRVYFKIDYTGNHTLMAYSLEAWDEGYHRLFRADPDTIEFYREKIVDAFQEQYDRANGKLSGWYFDEFDNGVIDAWVRVNKYLQDAGLPKVYLNGWDYNLAGNGPTDSLLLQADEDAVSLPVFMTEFYPYQIDSTCQPGSANLPAGAASTDPSSDVDYWRYEFDGEPCNWGNYRRGESAYFSPNISKMSLQASLDRCIWGSAPLYEIYDIAPHRTPLNEFIGGGLLGECKTSHAHGVKEWALLQSGNEIGIIDEQSVQLTRKPTQAELKLEAWLAVACDADGITWYSGMSSVRGGPEAGNWGGLLDWGQDSLHVAYDMNFCDGTPTVHGTPNYYAAKKVINEIHEIAPTLEALEFVKTYASRAFETSYPCADSANCPTHADEFYTGGGRVCWLRGIFSAHQQLGQYSDGEFSNAYPDSQNYVQVSRFMTPGKLPSEEDYWFLIVNRRALASETVGRQKKWDTFSVKLMEGFGS